MKNRRGYFLFLIEKDQKVRSGKIGKEKKWKRRKRGEKERR